MQLQWKCFMVNGVQVLVNTCVVCLCICSGLCLWRCQEGHGKHSHGHIHTSKRCGLAARGRGNCHRRQYSHGQLGQRDCGVCHAIGTYLCPGFELSGQSQTHLRVYAEGSDESGWAQAEW